MLRKSNLNPISRGSPYTKFGIQIIVVSLILATLTTGCLGERQQWSIDATGHDKKQDGFYVFDGKVRMGGHYQYVVADGVQVRFVNGDNETLEAVHVGELNVSRATVDLNVILDTRPRYVLVEVRQIQYRSGTSPIPGSISGLKRSGDHYLEYTAYGSSVTDSSSAVEKRGILPSN